LGKFQNSTTNKILKIAVIFLAVILISGIQAQVKTKGKPAPPKPCNNSGQCEWEEVNRSGEKQWCADCYPKQYSPLNLEPRPQIVAEGMIDFSYSVYRIFQFVGEDANQNGIGEYRDAWACPPFEKTSTSTVPIATIGDADNDGQKEIVAAMRFFAYKVGNEKNAVSYYFSKLFLFENGSNGDTAWESPYFDPSPAGPKDIEIGDVDRDGFNEIVILKGNHLSICEVNQSGGGYEFREKYVGVFPTYDQTVYSISLGDANNDGCEDIILAMFYVGAPIVWSYNGTIWTSTTAEPIAPEYWNPDINPPFLGIDTAIARDADNIPGNEIIAGGNNNRLMIWKYHTGNGGYQIEFISEDIGGITQGFDVGDIDGQPGYEIIVGDQPRFRDPALHIFKFVDGNYSETYSQTIAQSIFSMQIGDVDNDGAPEIVVSSGGVQIYEFFAGQFIRSYACVWGCDPRIN
jgi:hypothetical protein